MKKYKLTPEHEAKLPAWRDKWIANAMSTKPMDDEDRRITREAIIGLYKSAGLEPPLNIVFVPSPFVLRFAGGFAAAIWYLRGQKNEKITYAATDDATRDATRDATYAATYDATDAATYDATRDATRAATDNWYVCSLNKLIQLASIFGSQKFMLNCAQNSYSMWQGGYQWSAWDSFLSFFRNVVQLPIDYSKYVHWETAALHSGPRIVHPKFCMISDRPEILTVDERNLPHNVSGPFCRWRDGSALYSWHGIMIPAKWIENRKSLSAKEAITWPNIEQRRAACEILGWSNILGELKAKSIDKDDDAQIGELLEVELPDIGKEKFLKVLCGTGREFALPVPPDMKTALQANAWTYNIPDNLMRKKECRT